MNGFQIWECVIAVIRMLNIVKEWFVLYVLNMCYPHGFLFDAENLLQSAIGKITWNLSYYDINIIRLTDIIFHVIKCYWLRGFRHQDFFDMCIMWNFNAFEDYFCKYCRNNILSISIVIHVTFHIICLCIKKKKDLEFLSSRLSNDLFFVKIHLNVFIHVIR